MANSALAEQQPGAFKKYRRSELDQIPGGSTSADFPILTFEISELERNQKNSGREVFHNTLPPSPVRTSFPRLLSRLNKISMSRADLEAELSLILEMRVSEETEGDNEPAIYSVTALDPQPYSLPKDALDDLSDLPAAALSNARSGFLVHDELYALQSDPAKLHDLISIYLDHCLKAEVKLRRAHDANWRYVEVTLKD